MTNGETPPIEGVDCPSESMLLPVMTSTASLVGCFYIMGTYWRILALRQHPAGIMFGMSVYGAIYQFLYLLDQASSSIQCADMGIIVDFFLTGQETYMLIFAIDLLLALKNPFSASKGQMTKYHIFGGLWSLVCAVISHFDTRYALFGFCWLSSSGEILSRPRDTEDEDDEASNGTLTAGIFFALYIVVVYCTSLIAIVRTWNTFKKGLPDTFRTRQRIQRHLKYYVGCYFGYWTMVLSCYAVFSLLPHSHSDSSSNGGFRCRVWHLLSCLLLAKGMVHALIWTRTSNILKIIEQLRENGTVDLPAHDDNINWALRLEILTNTTKGICQSVDRAERQARASAESSIRSISAASGSSAEEGLVIEISEVQDDYCDRKESYTQIEEIILEKRNDRRDRGPRTDGVVFKDFAPHVFRRLREVAKVSSASYRNSLEQTTKERVSEGKSGAFFYFTEDRKYVVKTLTNEELKFLLSILPNYYTFMKRHPDTFMTRFFGCHGLTMYGKTVFFVVMQSVFATSLQIHERFDLKGSWVGRIEGRKPTGTIATCKFCGTEYIVGGSHDQRCDVRRGEGNMRHQYDQVGKDLNWNRHMALPYATARAVAAQLTTDSDFLCSINCIDYSLLVGIHHRSFNVSHYSSADSFDSSGFVHDSCCSAGNQYRNTNRSARSSSNGSSSSEYNFSVNSSFLRNRSSSSGSQSSRGGCHCSCKKTVQHFARGGMSVDAVHGPGLYYLGLIDILQQWNFRKRVEHFIRVYLLMQDRHGISVVNPRQYAERFQQRVIKELIYDTAAMPTRDQIEDISLTQLHIQDRRNAQLVESSRTLSTMIASIDSSAFASPPSIQMEHFPCVVSPNVGAKATSSPCTPPLALKTRASIRSVSSASASQCRASYSWENSVGSYNSSSGVGRLSGGLVMEIPASAPSLPMVYPTALDAPHLRRSLAPLTPSPRTSLSYRRDSEYSKSSNQRSASSVNSSEVASSVGSRQCSTGGNSSSSASVVRLEEGVLRGPSSPLDYRIVTTPTFPDKGGANAAALSA
nr:Phytopthora agathidicda GPCR-PIPK 8 [Phytophthora agathidicida]